MLALVLAASGGSCISVPATLSIADGRDREVLETALLSMLNDPEFDMAGANREGTSIVLNSRTPKGTGMLQASQIRSDVGASDEIPGDLEGELWRRNVVPGAGESTISSFEGLKFDRRIILTDLRAEEEPWPSSRRFGDAHPNARGWVEAWLPGYTANANRALVRAWIGPSPHGASATVLLEKEASHWVVKWRRFAWYA